MATAAVAFLGRVVDDDGMRYEYPDEIVIVARVPNAPIAEMLIGALKNNGIEAFYKPLEGGGAYANASATNPAGECAIYVARRDADRALVLLPPE